MKTITWIRHGKSSWENPKTDDHNRPLLPKGIKRTEEIANYLLENSHKPDLIISSTAKRAISTAHIIADIYDYPVNEIQEEHVLYEARSENYLDLVYPLESSFKHIIMVGHNPEITEVVNTFMSQKLDYLPTSGAVCINFDTNQWEQIMLCSHNLKFFITPGMLNI